MDKAITEDINPFGDLDCLQELLVHVQPELTLQEYTETDENLATGTTFDVNDFIDWREDLRSLVTSTVQSKKEIYDPEESEEVIEEDSVSTIGSLDEAIHVYCSQIVKPTSPILLYGKSWLPVLLFAGTEATSATYSWMRQSARNSMVPKSYSLDKVYGSY